MRLHVRNNCPLNERAKVYLNGVEQKFCTIVDDQEGFVERDVLDENGKPQLDPTGQKVLKERVAGSVVIIDPAFPGEPLDKWRIAPEGWQDR